MTGCNLIESLVASAEPLDALRNFVIIGAGLSAYWMGAAVRLATVPARRRRVLASAVLAIPLAFLVAPPLLFAVAGSTHWTAFAMALAASFFLGVSVNQRVVAHLTRLGLDL